MWLLAQQAIGENNTIKGPTPNAEGTSEQAEATTII